MKHSNLHKKPKSKRTAYSKASGDERVSRNWRKTRRLYERGEYSVAIIRCGTCIELAVNFAVKQELVIERKLPLMFVDKLLKSANGLRNKYQNIYLPIMEEYEEYDELKRLWRGYIEKVNKERNAIVHSGEFRSKKVAKQVMENTLAVLQGIMNLYDHSAELIGGYG